MASSSSSSPKKKQRTKDMPSSSSSSSSSSSPSLLFMSLPDDLVVNCIARISRSYYPSLSLVSKKLRSLILSQRLKRIRNYLGTKEEYVCVCLKLPDRSLVSWYSLWIKKTKQTLTMDKQNSTGNHLVPIPSSSYTHCVPILWFRVGSEIYTLGENDTPSTDMSVVHNGTWRKAPSMSVPRARAMNAHAVVLNEKIYVMGGCEKDESTYWAEVFDTKTQTWETLPDPGEELRFSMIKRLRACEGEIYVIISENEHMMKKHYVYNPEKGKWKKIDEYTPLSQSICWIKNMMYTCDGSFCYWCDTESKTEEWRVVMGLDLLQGHDMVETIDHGGKLVIFLEDRLGWLRQSDRNKKIWCAMVALERRNEDEVWGKIEWTDIVLEVPHGSTILGCENAWF